jgi:peptidoglycan/xylan/chitin deacetylase (PgdA/CDA1 family)
MHIIFITIIATVVILISSSIVPYLEAQNISKNIATERVVILNFDDNRKSQFTQVKPVLDKYGFKATFYVVCKVSG